MSIQKTVFAAQIVTFLLALVGSIGVPLFVIYIIYHFATKFW